MLLLLLMLLLLVLVRLLLLRLVLLQLRLADFETTFAIVLWIRSHRLSSSSLARRRPGVA
jgi:hypothetical protein